MTVEQLINKLSEYEPTMRIVVPGYEGGVDDINDSEFEAINIKTNVNTEWYWGKHERVYKNEGTYDEIALLLR